MASLSSPHHVLLLGGSGKVAQLLTPMLLKRSWTVTSIIRNPEQVSNLERLSPAGKGKLNVRVWSIEDEARSEEGAKALLDEVKPDYVVFSAGAGGKGGEGRTFKIDRDAAINFLRASASQNSPVKRFILISFLTSRLRKAPWWTDDQWREAREGVLTQLKTYYEAKVAADQALYEIAKAKGERDGGDGFAAVSLRPGELTLDNVRGVELGKTRNTSGKTSREAVAYVTAKLLDSEGLRSGWIDLLDGGEDPDDAVRRVVDEGVDCAEGEPFYEAK
ncbi:NAD dependent epimerase/dehydratase [Poronia punctata]|nr:NAD dependent epimerase/dehydratase [Poronia punctata]